MTNLHYVSVKGSSTAIVALQERILDEAGDGEELYINGISGIKTTTSSQTDERELCFGTDDYCLDDVTEIVFDISNEYNCKLYLTSVYEDYDEDNRTGFLIQEYGDNKVVEHSETYENLSPEEFMELCDQTLDDIEL